MKAENYKEYFKFGGRFYVIKNIDMYTDGGTIILETTVDKKFYAHKNTKKLHSEYPPSEENLITDFLLIEHLIDIIKSYIRFMKEKVSSNENILNDILKNK